MTTSGTANFTLDLAEIIEEAGERCAYEIRSGYDLKTARRSLNILLAEWANLGVNLWTVDQGAIPLTAGLSTYALPADTVDIVDHVIRTGANVASTQADLTITRVSFPTYSSIPNKLATGRPIQIVVQRQDSHTYPTGITLAADATATDTSLTLTSTTGLPATGFVLIDSEYIFYGYVDGVTLGGCFRGQNGSTAAAHLAVVVAPATPAAVFGVQVPSVTVWPTPDAAQTYQLVYWRMRRIQDAGNGTNTIDVPFRFVPPLIAGLAYHLAMKVPGGLDRLAILKQQYEDAWMLASSEDRDRASVRFVPKVAYV